MSVSDLIERIRPMPTEEKRALVEQIGEEFGDELGWIDPDLTPEQIAELERRVDELQKHPERGIPWEQVQADMKKKFGWD